MDTVAILSAVKSALSLIEGPYKWYIIAVIVVLTTALLTKFIFRTIKWFMLLILFGVLIFGIYWFLGNIK